MSKERRLFGDMALHFSPHARFLDQKLCFRVEWGASARPVPIPRAGRRFATEDCQSVAAAFPILLDEAAIHS
jgi:hypothetical protein